MKKVALGVAGTLGGLAAGWSLYSRFFVNHARHLPPAMDVPQQKITTPRAGELGYYRDEQATGIPLVLIHSVNAAASAYEMRPLFEFYRGKRPVYALDLPGFGTSPRPDRVYSPEFYAAAIVDFLAAAIPGNQAADIVALSLGSEFCARAALSRPELFRSLALISPTGFQSHHTSGGSDPVFKVFSMPLWSQAFYDLLTTRGSIRHYLKRSFVGTVDRGLEEYDFASSHQPGARYAPLYFISGKLFTPDVRLTIYSRVSKPVQVLYDRDGYIDFDRLPDFLNQNPNWDAVRIPDTLGLPQFEKLPQTTEALDRFWESRAASGVA